MTLRVWPAAVSLDPDARVLPAPLAATLAGAGASAPVILLVAGTEAMADGWSPNVAVALAEAWSRDGLRLVLADLSVGAPVLDRIVGEPNDEGLADVFLYGASLKRVVRGAPTRGFGFVPAGSAPADSREVLTDAGWRQLVTTFFRDGAVLLVYVPWDAPGLPELAARLGAVIALASPADLLQLDELLPPDAAVFALIEPPGAAEPGPVESTELAAPADVMEPAEAEVAQPELAAPAAVAEPAEAEVAQPAPSADVTEPVEAEVAHPELAAQADVTQPAEAEAALVAVKAAEPALAEAVAEAGEKQPQPQPQPQPAVTGEFDSSPADATAPSLAARDPRRKLPEDPHEALVEALWARRQGAQGMRPRGGAPAVDPVPGRKMSEEELLKEPPPLALEPRGRRLGLGLILWLILGAAVALGAVFGVEQYLTGRLPIIDQWLGRAPARAAAPRAAPAKAPAAGLAPRGAVDQGAPGGVADSLPYSVAIEAHPEYAVAVERAAQLRKDESAAGFFVTPKLHGGSIYYYVMAGPLRDSTAAAALVIRLLTAGVKTGTTPWDIVQTRLAFVLGDYASRAEAEQQGAALAQKSIPTYVVEVPLPGGPPRWRLYAGAFEGAADANVLRPVLKGAGVPDSLVPRIGRTTQ